MSDNKQQQIFTSNLNYYIEQCNKSQREIADKIGVSPQTFNTWCKGIAIPRMGKIQALADYFKIDKSDLIDERTTHTQRILKGVRIPVLGQVHAGIPIDAYEDILDYEEISPEMAFDGEYFGLQVKGDSMEPKFSEGDVVIVKKQEDAECGDIVIALINGGESTIKRLIKYDGGGIALVASNPLYAPMQFTEADIAEKPVTIVGKVVELRAKF